MRPSSSWSLRSSISVTVRRARGERRLDGDPAQQRLRAAAAGLQPDLVEAQDVAVAVRVRHLAHFVECVYEALELLCELAEHARERLAAATAHAVGERAVGAAAHRDVIVDVD